MISFKNFWTITILAIGLIFSFSAHAESNYWSKNKDSNVQFILVDKNGIKLGYVSDAPYIVKNDTKKVNSVAETSESNVKSDDLESLKKCFRSFFNIVAFMAIFACIFIVVFLIDLIICILYTFFAKKS